jgi:hypothetical protein
MKNPKTIRNIVRASKDQGQKPQKMIYETVYLMTLSIVIDKSLRSNFEKQPQIKIISVM